MCLTSVHTYIPADQIVTSNDGETSAVLERSVARVDYAKRRDRILNSKHGLEVCSNHYIL